MSKISTRTILEVQTEFAKNNGFGSEIFWDLLSANHGDILKEKIKNLFPDQAKGQKTIKKKRKSLFKNIWAQRKYSNRNSLSSIFYVLVTPETDPEKALTSTVFTCHPVFRTRKCIDESDSSNCCMIYIDEVGRVYQNWQSYLVDNILPKGTMVSPKRGCYTFDSENNVNLEYCPTPECSIVKTVILVADTTSAVTAVAAVGITITAAVTAVVAPPVAAAAVIAGLACAGYSAIRSGSKLVDRTLHDQSISLKDRQARSNWLIVLGGAVGLGSAGATTALSQAVSAGHKISEVTKLAVNGVNASSIIVSGGGVANNVLEMYLKCSDNEKISAPDVLLLAASLIIFTNSISNFRLTLKIISQAQHNNIQSFRQGLSNSQRQTFQKITKATLQITGPTHGHMDVIRNVNDIPSKIHLNNLTKPTAAANIHTQPQVSAKPIIQHHNNAMPVQSNNGVSVHHQIINSIPSSHTSNPINAPQSAQHNAAEALKAELLANKAKLADIYKKYMIAERSLQPFFSGIGGSNMLKAPPATLLQLTELLKQLPNEAVVVSHNVMFQNVIQTQSYENVIYRMEVVLTERTLNFLMDLAQIFSQTLRASIENQIQIKISMDDILNRLLIILDSYRNQNYEFLYKKKTKILKMLTCYFLSLDTNTKQLDYLPPSEIVDKNQFVILSNGTIIALEKYGIFMLQHIVSVESFEDVILSMATVFSETTFRFLLGLTQTFIETKLQDISKVLRAHVSTESVLYKLLKHCLEQYNDITYKYLHGKRFKILKALKRYFLSLNPHYITKNPKKCKHCTGYYIKCKL